jgi:putative hemolysin
VRSGPLQGVGVAGHGNEGSNDERLSLGVTLGASKRVRWVAGRGVVRARSEGVTMFELTLAVAFTLVISFACSISEASLLSIGHAQVQALGKSRAGRLVQHFKREIDAPIAAILILNTAANMVGASFAGANYSDVFGDATLWIFTVGFTLAVLFLSEIIPKTLGVAFSSRVIVPVAYLLRPLVLVLMPLLFVTRSVSRLLRGKKEAHVTSIEEIRLLASLGHAEGALTERTARIIDGAAALRELTAYDVMVPRTGVVLLSASRGFEENLGLVERSGHSRFPYSKDGDLDHVEGIVMAKELFFRSRSGEPDYQELVRPVTFVPSSTPLERLLRMFQDERRHLAIVVDEYGGTEGIVTLEDVLEELVGEIMDESDRIDPTIIRRGKNVLLCRGSAETRKVFELLGVHEEAEAVTLSGFVSELVERVPRAGDVVLFKGFQIKVLRASARRVERVEIRPAPAPANH